MNTSIEDLRNGRIAKPVRPFSEPCDGHTIDARHLQASCEILETGLELRGNLSQAQLDMMERLSKAGLLDMSFAGMMNSHPLTSTLQNQRNEIRTLLNNVAHPRQAIAGTIEAARANILADVKARSTAWATAQMNEYIAPEIQSAFTTLRNIGGQIQGARASITRPRALLEGFGNFVGTTWRGFRKGGVLGVAIEFGAQATDTNIEHFDLFSTRPAQSHTTVDTFYSSFPTAMLEFGTADVAKKCEIMKNDPIIRSHVVTNALIIEGLENFLRPEQP